MNTFSNDSAYPMPQHNILHFARHHHTAASVWTFPTPPVDTDSLWFFNRLIFIKISKHVTTMKWATVFHFYFPTKTRTVSVRRCGVDIIPFNTQAWYIALSAGPFFAQKRANNMAQSDIRIWLPLWRRQLMQDWTDFNVCGKCIATVPSNCEWNIFHNAIV